MEVFYGLTQPALTKSQPTTTIDLLITFRADLLATRSAGTRSALNLSMVIDKSGSMSGKPLKHATEAADLLVRQLSKQDTLSVVAYDDRIDTVVTPNKVTDWEAISEQIQKIRAGGMTNLHGGWQEGCKYVSQDKDEDLARRVLLLTDGQANVGISDNASLIAAARAESKKGIITTTLGFGSGFNEDLLIGMAEASGGNFYYIETPEDATQVFLIEGESLTALAARNLTLTFMPAPNSGVKILSMLNNYPVHMEQDGSMRVNVGDVYGGEDKLLAIQLEVPASAEASSKGGLLNSLYKLVAGDKDQKGATSNNAPLLNVLYQYLVAGDQGQSRHAEGELNVTIPVISESDAQPKPDADLLQAISRIRIARAKEEAVVRADAQKYPEAVGILRHEVGQLRQRGMDEEFEIAEEMAQLEYFADAIEHQRFNTETRKMMRDQSYQGRTRNRTDLNARGSAGGSAQSLNVVDNAAGRVMLGCVREGGKLRMKVLSEEYDGDLKVLFPRTIREEGVRYVVDGLEISKNGTFYTPVGKIDRMAGKMANSNPSAPLNLIDLFNEGGETWFPLLQPVIESHPEAHAFIGPQRDKNIVPVRELTFQALKPNPPEKWKVVVFGQNPYPRMESATGIAMFDNTFNNWKDSQFGKVTSIRCIIKAATMWKHNIPKATPIADIRALLAKENTVQPPEWFQAMLTQGVLLLNASLTANSDTARNDSSEIARHTSFWKPVVEKIIEEILSAKQNADEEHKGVVFAWWGAHAKNLRRFVEKAAKKYPKVPIKHIDHPNPAAQGDIFCDNNHFGTVNDALKSLNMKEIDWLPAVGWNKSENASAQASAQAGVQAGDLLSDADKMGNFIARTMELHKFYLERLQEVKDEGQEGLSAITGINTLSPLPFMEAVTPLLSLVKGLEHYAKKSVDYAQRKVTANPVTENGLSEHEIAAIHLYTCESIFYREMNLALRHPDRDKVKVYYPYLNLLISALAKLKKFMGSLWRGVAMDLRFQYPKDSVVTWWGVSSCTPKLSIAHSFLGAKGKRTLFEVRTSLAVSIKPFSAFTGEEEFLLSPGTRLKVVEVKSEKSGLNTIILEELVGERDVS